MKLALQLHRSLTFWAGILVMGFIVWAWRDSLREGAVCRWNDLTVTHAAAGVSIARQGAAGSVASVSKLLADRYSLNSSGALYLLRIPALPAPLFLRGRGVAEEVYLGGNPYLKLDADGPPPYYSLAYSDGIRYRMELSPRDCWNLFIPHWLVLAVVAPLWVGLVVWRAKRRKRMTNVEFPNAG